MQARWFLPEVGRFISADTIIPQPADPQSHNRYSYTVNRPVVLVDPSGHNYCSDPDEPCDPDGSLPPPAPPPLPPLAEHQGNEQTVQPGRELTEEEILFLVLAIFAETQGGNHLDQAMILKAWTYLNKLSLYPDQSVFETIINGTSDTLVTHKPFLDAFREALGPFPGSGTDAEKFDWLVASARLYMEGGSANAKRFQHLYELIAGDGGVYSDWLAHGSNSWADPTHGAVFAVDRNVANLEALLTSLDSHAQNNAAFSYVVTSNNATTVTVVGNDHCIYDQSLCN